MPIYPPCDKCGLVEQNGPQITPRIAIMLCANSDLKFKQQAMFHLIMFLKSLSFSLKYNKQIGRQQCFKFKISCNIPN
jgi:hypothetical protein